jgi:hypothetical protein
VSFDRGEFLPELDASSPHLLARVGFAQARWLLESGAGWTECAEATYVAFPATTAYFDACAMASSTPVHVENVDAASESVRYVREGLQRLIPSLSERPKCLLAELERLDGALRTLAAFHRGLTTEVSARRAAISIADGLERVHCLQAEAIALRDGSSTPS